MSMTVLASMVVWASTAAGGESLEQARALTQELKYEKAAAILAELRRDPALTREQLGAVYELTGVVAATLKQPAKAAEAFTKLLSLMPSHQFTSSHSPRVMTPYYQAKSALERDGPLAIAQNTGAGDPAVTRIAFSVKNGALHQIKVARLHRSWKPTGPFDVIDVTLQPSAQVDLPSSLERYVRWWVELIDDLGRSVHVAGSPEAPFEDGVKPSLVLTPAPPLVTSHTPTAPNANRFMAPAIGVSAAAVASLGVGLGFGLSAQGARREFEALSADANNVVTSITRAQANDLSNRAQVHGQIANVAFAAAGGLAIAAGVLFVVGAVTVSPTPQGVQVTGTLP